MHHWATATAGEEKKRKREREDTWERKARATHPRKKINQSINQSASQSRFIHVPRAVPPHDPTVPRRRDQARLPRVPSAVANQRPASQLKLGPRVLVVPRPSQRRAGDAVRHGLLSPRGGFADAARATDRFPGRHVPEVNGAVAGACEQKKTHDVSLIANM